MSVLLLLGLSAHALAGGQDVLNDAQDGHFEACYSQADFRDALHKARADQRLYSAAVDTIIAGQVSNRTVPGRPCGSARTVPRHPVAVSSSGATTLWAGAALLVVLGAAGAGLTARRASRGDGA